MHQLIGLILLIAAIVGVFYVSTHYTELLKFKIPLPVRFLQPITLPAFNSGGGGTTINPIKDNFQPQTALEPQKLARIGSVQLKSGFYPYQELVIYSNAVSGRTDITGWIVKSNNGSFTIPTAQEVYSFGGNQGDINLRNGDSVHIYSGSGQKGNFRLNKCIGYIEDVAPFSPPLPKSCPNINRAEINNLTGACQDYINSLRSCQNPNANPPVSAEDSSCHQFLSKLNYVGCVEKYGRDSDFSTNEWRVWAGTQADIFDALHDKVQLLDRSGKLVDEYVY